MTIPNSVSDIGFAAFSNCMKLKSITLSNNLKNIEPYTFSGCESLTDITIPNSVTEIGSQAFRYCSNLNFIKLPDNITSIGKEAFQQCYALTSINIPCNVKTIEERTFYNCENLASATISDGVKSIGDRAFYGCKALTCIEIPNSVTNLEERAFAFCENLEHLTMSDNIQRLGKEVFGGTKWLKVQQDEIIYINDYICYSCNDYYKPHKDGTVSLKPSTKIIAGGAFYLCENLKEITIPNNVNYIGNEALAGCYNLHTITVRNSQPASILLGSDIFSPETYSNTMLNVPLGASDAYKEATVWKEFSNIIEKDDETGMESYYYDSHKISIKRQGNCIEILDSPHDAIIEVHTINGTVIYKGKDRIISIPEANTYIVNVAEKSFKVSL